MAKKPNIKKDLEQVLVWAEAYVEQLRDAGEGDGTEGETLDRIWDSKLIKAAPALLKALDELNQAIVAYIKPGDMLKAERLKAAHVAALKAMGQAGRFDD